MKSLNIISENLTKILLGSSLDSDSKFFIQEMKTIGIDKLPYSYSSLRRFIDPETMKFHYQKHYKTYGKKLNQALRKKDYGDVELEKIVKQISKYNTTIRNNAGGAFNHALFWKMLSPTPQKPNGKVLDEIVKNFGTYRKFKDRFESVAKKRFGSGWVWLVVTKSGRLKVMSTQNQDNPLMNIYDRGGFPILGLDLWEHAYYLKYQNKRDEYIQNFWEAINWKFVNELYLSKTEKKLNESKILIESTMPQNETQNYSFILNNNKNLVWIFRRCIDDILKDVYAENYYGNDQYREGEMSGVYDIESKGRSVLNKLNTNHIGFSILLNDVNKVLERNNQQKIELVGKTPGQQIKEVERFCEYLKLFKNRIFPNSKTLEKIMGVLTKTNKKGQDFENEVVSRLKKEFGDDNVKSVGSLGSKEDMVSGIDLEVTIDGSPKTAQLKPIYDITTSEGKYIVKIKGFVKPYKTDLLIFGNPGSRIYIFKNKDVDSSSDFFKIPTENLIYQLN